MSRDRRSVLHSAFSFVRSYEANRATANVTLDHVLAQQVKFLKKDEKRVIVDASGESVGDRVSRYDSLQALKEDLEKVLKEMRNAKTEEELQGLGFFEASAPENET